MGNWRGEDQGNIDESVTLTLLWRRKRRKMVGSSAKKPQRSVVKLTPAEREAEEARKLALTSVKEKFQDLDIVWAKMKGFPWWPSIIFFSWDAVQDAGLAKPNQMVEIPQPRKIVVNGVVEDVVQFCLVMFLDKFDINVLQLEPKSICSFTVNYTGLSKAGLSNKAISAGMRASFRRALAKSEVLLHMGNEYTEEDLALLNAPPPTPSKRRCMHSTDMAIEEEWCDEPVGETDNDEEEQSEKEYTEEAADNNVRRNIDRKRIGKKAHKSEAKAASGTQKKVSARRDKLLMDDDDFEESQPYILAAKASKKAPRKASRKDSRILVYENANATTNGFTHIDLTESSDSLETYSRTKGKTGKKSKGDGIVVPSATLKQRQQKKLADTGKSSGDMSVNGSAAVKQKSSRGKNQPRSNAVAESDNEAATIAGDSSELVLTPLSHIWTTHADTETPETDKERVLTMKQDLLWNDDVFTDQPAITVSKANLKDDASSGTAALGNEQRAAGKRQMRSVHQSQIRQNLMMGNLDPHTMVQCEAYRQLDVSIDNANSRSRGGATLDPPFRVIVHPDAVFVCDLHAHLATCEIIGFLGGRWDEETKTLYIQAAFPCRSLMIDGDDGSTDVEMDPGSEIELREIIKNAQLEVVGWYHSHPAFAPDPSIRDIENQASYQQLFQRHSKNDFNDGKVDISEPFVGLIVGTYDTRRESPLGLFRYFHVREEKVSGGARREIFMPYELVPVRRHYYSVVHDEERQLSQGLSIYTSVFRHFYTNHSTLRMRQVTWADIDERTSVIPELDPVVAAPQRKSPNLGRKRKQSTDGLIVMEKPLKQVKRKRGKKDRVLEGKHAINDTNQIDLTSDNLVDIDAMAQEVEIIDVTGRDDNIYGRAQVSAAGDQHERSGEVESLGFVIRNGLTMTRESADHIDSLTDETAQSSTNLHESTGLIPAKTVASTHMLSETNAAAEDVAKNSENLAARNPLSSRLVEADESASEADVNMKHNGEGKAASATKNQVIVSSDNCLPCANIASLNDASSVDPEIVTTLESIVEQVESIVRSSAVSVDSERNSETQTAAIDSERRTAPLNAFAFIKTGENTCDKLIDVKRPVERTPPANSTAKIHSNHILPRAESVGFTAARPPLLVSSGRKRNRKSAAPTKKPNVIVGHENRSPHPSLSPGHGRRNHANTGFHCIQLAPERSFSAFEIDTGAKVEEDKYIVVEDTVPMKALGDGSNSSLSKVTKTYKFETGVLRKEDGSYDVKHDPDVDVKLTSRDRNVATTVTNGVVNTFTKATADTSAMDGLKTEDATTASDDTNSQVETMKTVNTKNSIVKVSNGTSDFAQLADPTYPEKVEQIANGGDKAITTGVKTEDTLNVLLSGANPTNSGNADDDNLMKHEGLVEENGISATEHVALPQETREVKHEVKVSVSTAIKQKVKLGRSDADKDMKLNKRSLLLGKDREVEDFRTSLENLSLFRSRLKLEPVHRPNLIEIACTDILQRDVVSAQDRKVEEQVVDVPTDANNVSHAPTPDDDLSRTDRLNKLLQSLRTNYGSGIGACAEQVITLVDYYRDFERRTDLKETWRNKIKKVEKIEASLLDDVQYVNLPVDLRVRFVEDIMAYLKLSWKF